MTTVREQCSVDDPMLTEHQVAKMLNVSVQTVRRMRADDAKEPLMPIRIGASVRYDPDDVRDYIRKLRNVRQSGHEPL